MNQFRHARFINAFIFIISIQMSPQSTTHILEVGFSLTKISLLSHHLSRGNTYFIKVEIINYVYKSYLFNNNCFSKLIRYTAKEGYSDGDHKIEVSPLL